MPNADEHYKTARKMFEENGAALARDRSDPVSWKLQNGLWHLTNAIQTDIQNLHTRLDRLEIQLLNMERRIDK